MRREPPLVPERIPHASPAVAVELIAGSESGVVPFSPGMRTVSSAPNARFVNSISSFAPSTIRYGVTVW